MPKKRGPIRAERHDPVKLPGARAAPLPQKLTPQLATLTEAPPEGEQWIHEIKLDGYRILCRLEGRRVRLITRRGNDWTEVFPTLARAVAALPARQALIDGEVVKLDERGVSEFQALQNALSTGREHELVYEAFDLLHLDGQDLTQVPLIERKRLLSALLEAARGPLLSAGHVEGDGKRLFEEACRLGLEGIVSKRRDGRYRQGRSLEWLKTKCCLEQEFVVTGWTEPAGSRSGFGALLLAVHDGRGRLEYAGKVGTGFTEATLKELHRQLERREQSSPPHSGGAGAAPLRGVHWVRPELVAQVRFSSWTEDGRLRHPTFRGLRRDKSAREVVRETARPAAAPASRRRSPSVSRARGAPAGVVFAGVRLTNPDRLLYPAEGITKEALANYYSSIAQWILPEVGGRLLTLVRCPLGREGRCFFQKHPLDSFPSAVHRLEVREKTKLTRMAMIDCLEGLVALVQMSALEIHIWGSRVDRLEFPDRLVLDLDPAPHVSWKELRDAARHIRRRFQELGLESFVKTTGGKGLHVVLPLAAQEGWDEVKEFARVFARRLVEEAPEKYTDIASKRAREGKIFIDYLRNGRGATAIASYSTRAREGCPVSTPLSWDELRADVRQRFHLKNLPARLKRLRRDPWEGYTELRQTVRRALEQAAVAWRK
jgi:bifunctional non-homologous end joining protein LigD